jgi:ribosome-binding protein aMBF1 (putative translation factor)
MSILGKIKDVITQQNKKPKREEPVNFLHESVDDYAARVQRARNGGRW